MIRTDLAMEADNIGQRIPGVEVINDDVAQGVHRVRVSISSQEGEKAIGKKMGTYVTIEADALAQGDADIDEGCAKALANEIKNMAGETISGSVLIVGLGNRMVTPDSLGPSVCDAVFVTRHIHEYAPDSIDARIGTVSALSPGVLGITGIETGEIIEGVISRLKPSLVIAVDSLASRSIERVRKTIQLADSGISPGAGIGNKRKALNKETLGVPVLVYASTVAQDLLTAALEKTSADDSARPMLENVFSAMMESPGADMIVTPKEIDKVVIDLARIIADALNMALHQDITLEETRRYMH